jgi:hypothetical protein
MPTCLETGSETMYCMGSHFQVRLAMELVFEGLQSNDRPRAHVTGAPPGSEAPSITIADAVTLTLVEQQQQQPELPQPQQQDAAGIEYPLLQQRQQQQPGSASAPLRIQALKAEAAPSLPVSSIVDKTVVKLEAAPPEMEPQKVLTTCPASVACGVTVQSLQAIPHCDRILCDPKPCLLPMTRQLL